MSAIRSLFPLAGTANGKAALAVLADSEPTLSALDATTAADLRVEI